METPSQDLELVTLSLTSSAKPQPDGQELEDLALLLHQQGAHTVLSTQWQVRETSRALLLRAFYKALAKDPRMSKAQALSDAQSQTATGKLPGTEKRYTHPYYWAGFVMYGE